MRRQSGFTLVELMITIGVVAILSAIAVPNFISWIPKYRLKAAASELFSNMQLARMTAVKENTTCTVTFSQGPDRYVISIPGKTIRTVNLASYGSGVTFKHDSGSAAIPSGTIQFNSRGFRNPPSSYAYLSNQRETDFYRVGALSSGVIKLQRLIGNDYQ